jgi:hypothetical protein
LIWIRRVSANSGLAANARHADTFIREIVGLQFWIDDEVALPHDDHSWPAMTGRRSIASGV